MAGLLSPQYQDEDAAREFLEKQLWPNGPVCPHCGLINEAVKLDTPSDEDREKSRRESVKTGTRIKRHARKGLYQCVCRKQFTVTVDTIFEDSHIPLNKWLMAIHLMCSSKKGISALQLQRELWGEDEITKKIKGSYRTAWFMCHRVRWAMTQEPFAKMLKGTVEVDETYVGGKEKGKRGLPGKDSKKTPVLALVERGGDVRSFPLKRVTNENIKPIMTANIDPKTHLMTDEHAVYYFLKDEFPTHDRVMHKTKEYVRQEGDIKVTTNTVESYFSLMKRSNYGIYHHWSRKYLGQYCAERDFVYNGRKLTDSERRDLAINGAKGKRLMLKEPRGAIKE